MVSGVGFTCFNPDTAMPREMELHKEVMTLVNQADVDVFGPEQMSNRAVINDGGAGKAVAIQTGCKDGSNSGCTP